jgi:type IV pilus assembly protein PilB
MITEERLLYYLGEQLGLMNAILERFFIADDTLSLLDEDFIRENELLPLFVEGERLHIAMVDPLDTKLIKKVESKTGLSAEVYVSSRRGMSLCLAVNLKNIGNVTDVGDEAGLVDAGRILRFLLLKSQNGNCSEIHIEGKGEKVSVRLGWGKRLKIVDEAYLNINRDHLAHIKKYLGIGTRKLSRARENISIARLGSEEVSMMVSTLETLQGESLVIKIVNRGLYIEGLKGIGLRNLERKQCGDMVSENQGLIVVASPPGSGKTLTMYALLKHLADLGKSVYLLEDSVLDVLDFAYQVPIGGLDEKELTASLSKVMRHSPDVVAVGELGDVTTLRNLLSGAAGTTLVVGTLQAHDFSEAWIRLRSMSDDPDILASRLVGIVSQVLLRPFCHDCLDNRSPDDRDVCPSCSNREQAPPSPVFQVVKLDNNLRVNLEKCFDSSSVDNLLKENGVRVMADVIREGSDTLKSSPGSEIDLSIL